ncbi:Endo-1,4-beta-xylanase C [Carex littledalei]|uniref:Endo-1,4-beta-xylanase C n=1 Tax=Carex littledalei TaxID=544730 RepID=A0A833VML7_9POAL|nr:Endo-1,4-beta-xylanase C [Carex littledalei]
MSDSFIGLVMHYIAMLKPYTKFLSQGTTWVQVDKGSADVRASVKTPSGFVAVGSVVANASCWSMLKGGLTVNVSGPGDLYFEIWVDNVSFQPFTQEEWKGHHNESADQKNKKPVTVTAADKDGKPIAGAKVTVNPTQSGFPFGMAINAAILKNTDYQKWFASRFTVTTFENEMKWYGTEYTQGHEDFSVADAMLEFAKKNNVHVRGHNVFWDDQKLVSC